MSDITFFDLSETRQSSCFVKILYLLFIPLAIFLAIIAGYLQIIPFRVEIHSLFLIGTIFIIYIFFLKHNAFYASCKFKNELDFFKKELKQYIQKNELQIGSKEKANAPFDAFAKEYTSKLRNENFASIAAGIFPTLGILGTFISIAISMPDFSSKTSAVLEKEISLLLGGVGTAFYVSIYGIFLSIWWILFDKTGISAFEKSINYIKESTKSLFWSKEEIEQTYFQKSMENFERLNSVFDNFAKDEIIENMNKTLTQRIEMFDKIITLEQQSISQTSKIMNENLEITNQAQNTQKEIFEEFKTILDEMKKTSLNIEQNNVSLENISNSLQSKEENLANIANSLKNINSENIDQLYNAIVKNFEVMKKDTDQIGWSFNSYLNEFDDKFSDKLKNTLVIIDSEVAKIVSSLAEVHNVSR
ncbi:MotA/TolQ/ExbB proton channel family protein [Sulfurospirillum sp.]|nr:MotA/TolQ/ExbB proton channel family protein [Sulfurospirillum sp.]